jgi:BASS family bile acid:Na+ symporter
MSLADLLPILIQVSIFLTVLGFGLGATWEDVTYLFRRPSLLFRSLLSIYVILPVVVIILISIFQLKPPIESALVILAISPIPPFIPGKQLKLGGRASYIYGLLVAASVLSVIFVPLGILIIGAIFSTNLSIPLGKIISVILITVLVPLGLGVLIRSFASALADKAAPIISKIAMILLVVALIPVLIAMGSAMISLVGDGTLLAISVVVIIGIVVGHLLGGPEPGDRTALAIATSSRHPAVAIGMWAANMGSNPANAGSEKLVPVAIVMYLLLNLIVSIPYSVWRKRQHAAEVKPAGDRYGTAHRMNSQQ